MGERFNSIRPPKKLGDFRDAQADKFGEELSRTFYDLLRELKKLPEFPQGGHTIVSGATPDGWTDVLDSVLLSKCLESL